MTCLMTEREKADTMLKVCALRAEGREEEASILHRTLPLPPFLAAFLKEHGKIDFLKNSGWNMAEAEAAFGRDWLTR